MLKKELPDGWKWKILGEIGDIFSGSTPSTSDSENFEGNIPWITPADLSNYSSMYIERGKRDISEKGLNNSSATLLPKGTVLFSSRAPVGYVAIAAKPLATNQGFKNLVLKCDDISPEYVFYYLRANTKLAEKYASGTTFLEVSASRFAQIPISIPPLNTQRKIVAILEKAEATQRLRAEADALMQELHWSIFFAMFENPNENPLRWSELKLSEILIEDPQNGLYKPSTDYGEGTPILRIDSFYEGKIVDIRNLKRLRCSSAEIEKYKLKIGDILINRVNSLEYIGKCGLVEYLPEPTVYESNMMRLRLNSAVANPFYIASMLCTSFIKGQIISRAKKAVNQASINQKDVLSLKVLVPPIELQNEYENRVRRYEGVQKLQERSQREQKGLMVSVMSKAFTGDLVA